MILLFQLLFTSFTLYAIFIVVQRKKEALLGMKGMLFWLFFWIASLVSVWWPNSTSVLAHALGIGRGVDLIIYVSIALIFFLLFKLHIKIESVGRDVTKLVRTAAIHTATKKRE
ncbi:MAG: DUF2304 family protein [Candidatus Magasanikbacteria bacterium]|jgi:hypothetical protein|nr:DUF2304 family protein [Candidatus Magasanikbacteria bacterium]